jgi:hypothetical protein
MESCEARVGRGQEEGGDGLGDMETGGMERAGTNERFGIQLSDFELFDGNL